MRPFPTSWPRPARLALPRLVAAVGLALGVASALGAPSAAAATTPTFGHVWQIQLENESASSTFSPTSPATYLNNSLVPAGVLLQNYYATGHVSLDNYLSQTAGIPGNLITDTDCQAYTNYVGASPDVNGVAPGGGCVYPASVPTFESQLTAINKTWHGYMEDMGNTPTRETTACGQPTAGNGSTAPADPAAVPPVQDDTQTATAGDQYAARHNPFVYFHSLLDVPSGATTSPCAQNVVPFTQFTASLTNPPNFNWITPNLCNDGHDAPCVGADITGSKVGGLTSADHFLSVVVPEIMQSPAYQADGLIVVTFDEASTSDSSSCCGEVHGTTGVQPAGGGGRTGALLLSPLLTPHAVTTAYNHYSLLRTLEDNFATTGGTDGQGHLQEAALVSSFGSDVFAQSPVAATPEIAQPALLVIGAAAILAGGVVFLGRRRSGVPSC